MVSAGMSPKNLGIEHEGEPCERYPVPRVERGDAPHEVSRVDPGENMRIVTHVDQVIHGDKVERMRLPIDGDGGDRQTHRDQERGSPVYEANPHGAKRTLGFCNRHGMLPRQSDSMARGPLFHCHGPGEFLSRDLVIRGRLHHLFQGADGLIEESFSAQRESDTDTACRW